MHADHGHEQQVHDAQDEKVLLPCLILFKQCYMPTYRRMRNQMTPTCRYTDAGGVELTWDFDGHMVCGFGEMREMKIDRMVGRHENL